MDACKPIRFYTAGQIIAQAAGIVLIPAGLLLLCLFC